MATQNNNRPIRLQ